MLSAPDTVLIERNLGKRIDPQTGGMAMATPTQPHGVSETLVVTACLPFPELPFCSGHPQRDTRKAPQAGLWAGSHWQGYILVDEEREAPFRLKEETFLWQNQSTVWGVMWGTWAWGPHRSQGACLPLPGTNYVLPNTPCSLVCVQKTEA